jgi:hypothetical protein
MGKDKDGLDQRFEPQLLGLSLTDEMSESDCVIENDCLITESTHNTRTPSSASSTFAGRVCWSAVQQVVLAAGLTMGKDAGSHAGDTGDEGRLRLTVLAPQ